MPPSHALPSRQPPVIRLALTWLAGLTLLSACATTTPQPAPRPTAAATVDPAAQLAAPMSAAEWRQAVPALATREAEWAAVLAGDPPIRALAGDLDANQTAAQALALADAAVRAATREEATGQPLRAEVMQVRPLLPADVVAATEACRDARCYRVEVYNYATNSTVVATVDPAGQRVVAVETLANTQPEVPPQLADLAAQIASRAPEVKAALGLAPDAETAGMPNVKTALNGSRCERSRHLCVAPTFMQGDRALWAIVDLTDGRLVGVRWTELGQAAGAVAVTEQSLEDDVVMTRYCEKPTHLEEGDWTMTYVLTPSDGLEVKDVRFQGRQVLKSAKLVDWHVSYSGTEGFGYSDAIGCPKFSTASVVAFNGPGVEPIEGEGQTAGFALSQDFRSELWPLPCNYRYVQRYEFYEDGRFRVGGANLGRGCGNQGIYRPVLRLDVTAGSDGSQDRVDIWDGAAWQPWPAEGWRLQTADTPYTPEGFQLRVRGNDGPALAMAPNRGQFGDGSRGDDAYVYLTLAKAAEGEGDLLTLGACCNSDEQQGPEQFIQPPEAVDPGDVVLWYVPQLANDDSPGAQYCWVESEIVDGKAEPKVYPCAYGPMFVPQPATP